MTMDIVLIGMIAGFIFGGFRTGFLWRLLGIVFIVVAALAGAYFRYPVGVIAKQAFPDIPADYANLVGYAIAFPAILVGLRLAEAVFLTVKLLRGTTVPATLAVLSPVLPRDLSALLPDGLPSRLPFPFPSSKP